MMDADQLARRLSAMLAGDIKGFSRLVAEDELNALRLVKSFRSLARDQVEQCRGRLVDNTGDGFLAEFSSIVDAARCAVALQRRIAAQSDDRPDSRRLVVQMGLSLGEVIHFEHEVLGMTVILAFQLARLADRGGVAIVASAADQLAGSGEFELAELGERSMRGLERPVHIQHLRTGVELPRDAGDAGDEPERRLAAILEADVVSWSRLVATREAETIEAITDCRDAMLARVRQRRGRVVDSTGDNLLAEFRSALDAVLCAIEIQREHAARNADLKPDERLEFRIGIHLGDVRVDGERIYGSGVNIAARLEALASPGGICISASVHEQVRYHLEVEFHDLGEQALKNIPHPVRAYALGGAPRSALRSPRLFGRLRRWMASSP